MNHLLKTVCFSFLIVSFLCAGCASSVASPQAVKVDRLTVTFEPGKCSYAGPKVISQGKVTAALDNPTNANVSLNIKKFCTGKTWQDLVDVFKENNKAVVFPDWICDVSSSPNMDNYAESIYTLEPGSYAITCGEILTGSWATWLASPLTVE